MKNNKINLKTQLTALILVFVFLVNVTGFAESTSPTSDNQLGNLTDIQRNSISMLNYLTTLTQQINSSKNSRLYLEEAYSSLVNNISPNAIDARTLEQLMGMLDSLENYRMVNVKRERIQYYHEQANAQTIKSLVPNPLNLISIAEAGKPSMIALTILSTAFDIASEYFLQIEEDNIQMLAEGWEINDEETAILHNTRKNAFSYMVSIVNEQGLPGNLALNENAVNAFVKNRNNSNVVQKIQFLESNKETYQAFGPYWLVLAENYYYQEEYSKCLDALAVYKSLGVQIFRKDYDYAKILPLAISALEETSDESTFVSLAEKYTEAILKNTDADDWMLRYYVAQIFIDLFGKTNDTSYLQKSYNLVLDNINTLADKQKELNSAYLTGVILTPVPKDANKSVKTEITQFNKFLEEERKTSTPPIYEPLLLNCDLLFMLAEELKINDAEKAKVDAILHENGSRIFLIPAVDNKYRFSQFQDSNETADEVVRAC